MSKLSWAETVRLVHERALFRCEYCQTGQNVIGQPMHVEHILPNRDNSLENLCLSCAACNMSKARAIQASDPSTGLFVDLFNPRIQIWREHFSWESDGTVIQGLTATGRATTLRLKMNLPTRIRARQVWVRSGEHPPS